MNNIKPLLLIIIVFSIYNSICSAASCNISAQDINFGNYSTIDTSPTDANGQISVNCTGFGLVRYITLSPGQSGSVTARSMLRSGGTETLNYNLYQDSSYTQIWGNTGGTRYRINQLSPYQSNIPVYGRIPALQSVPPGLYQDQITATITFF